MTRKRYRLNAIMSISGAAPVVPDVITLTTTLTGDFTINLQGTGDVTFTWPDLTTEIVPLDGMGDVEVHHTLDEGGIIEIASMLGITQICFSMMEVTAVSGLTDCLNITDITASDNLITLFDTSQSWTALFGLVLDNMPITNLITYPEWTNLTVFTFNNTGITEITTYAEWVNLRNFGASGNHLTSVTFHQEWINLEEIDFSNNDLTESAINAILVVLDSIWGEDMAFEADLSGGTNATPTGLGITAYDSLIAKGNAVTVNGYPVPVVVTATIESSAPADVVLTFNTNLNSEIIPDTTDFVLTGKTISNVAIADNVATITVSVPYVFGNTVDIDYTQGTNILTASNGAVVASFADQAVINNIAE